MQDCTFCKIVRGEVPSEKEYENDDILVIHDINPKDSLHLLIIPKIHVSDITQDSGDLWKKVGEAAKHLAKQRNLAGFRLVHNAGNSAAVAHMHIHLLGNVSKDREV